MNKRPLDPGMHVDLAGALTYGEYLKLDQLLTSQLTRSGHHDELLFVIQHQTSELWMKLMIHELTAVLEHVRADHLEAAFKILSRVGHIQRMLFDQWGVLETLTPSEYLQFRHVLGPASGFQSFQYRALEFLLGNKDDQALKPFRHTPELHDWLARLLQTPSVYDEFLRYLSRHGHTLPKEVLERDFAQPYQRHPQVVAVFKEIYEQTDRYWDEYEMCEKLVDVEERFQLWRFRHMKTVQRIIGFKTGTGGSSGVAFLKKAMDYSFFPELWDVRTELTPPRQG